ncbi:hypothetical protein AB0I51_22485 [Streptomyces sp. NPDC050549]
MDLASRLAASWPVPCAIRDWVIRDCSTEAKIVPRTARPRLEP